MTKRRQHGEGSIYERKDRGQWVAVADLGRALGGGRDRREFTAPTMTAAVAKRDEFMNLRRNGYTLPRGRQPTVAEWLLHWVHVIAKAQVEPTTWHKSYRSKVEDLIVPYFTGVPLADLDEELVGAWQLKLLNRVSARTGHRLAPATVTQAQRIFSVAVNVAVARKKMPRNPVSNVRAPKPGDAEIMPPTDEEVEAILARCEERRTGPRWKAGIGTGGRQGEILAMMWPLVHVGDTEAAWIDVQWELVRLPWQHGCEDPRACGGKYHVRACPAPCPKIRASGRRHACIPGGDGRCCPDDCAAHARRCPLRCDGGLRLKRPKSSKSRRQVPLMPGAAEAVAAWKITQKAEKLAHGEGWGGWHHDDAECPRRPRSRELVCAGCSLPARPGLLAWTQPSGMPVDPRRDWQDWSDLLAEAGVEHSRVHDGRHYVATVLLEEGTDIRVVQELLGHSSSDFTRRAYQHVRPDLKRAAADTLQRRLGRRR